MTAFSRQANSRRERHGGLGWVQSPTATNFFTPPFSIFLQPKGLELSKTVEIFTDMCYNGAKKGVGKMIFTFGNYTVDGIEIIKKKWLKSSVTPPGVNDPVTVIYQEDNPTKFRLEI